MPRDDTRGFTRLRDEAGADDKQGGAAALENIEAEHALLGAILVNNKAYESVVEIVRSGDFANPANGRIFTAIGTLIDRGEVANPVTLKLLFDQDGALASIGGAQYLAKLADSAVTIINSRQYARDIRKLSDRRALLGIYQAAIADIRHIDLNRTTAEIIADVDGRILDSDEGAADAPTPNLAAISAAIAAAEQVYKTGAATGIPTGLADLDKKIGGLRPGNLIFVAGRPSMGKTGLAVGIATHAAAAGTPVLFCSLEMTDEELGQRQLAGHSGISLPQQQRGPLSREQMDALIAAGVELNGLPLAIDDNPKQTVAHIRRRALRLKRRGDLGLLIVDHLHLIDGENARTESRVQELSAITRGLKGLAKALDVPVLALAQLNRDVEKRPDKRPQLSDLRDSGSIEQDGDLVILLFREEYYLEREPPTRRADQSDAEFSDRFDKWTEQLERTRSIAELNIAKQRNGETGLVKVRFDAVRVRFENLILHRGECK